ncbi:prolipoprotein diacylglyceryl transferase family protein [Rhodanobacter sp. UC4450_H17]
MPLNSLLVLAGWGRAIAVGGWLQRRGRPSTEAQLWRLLLAGVLAARLAFVVRWWPEYAGHPLAMLDLRDGGLSRWAGSLAVLAGAAWIGWRRRPLREPMAWALLGAVLVRWLSSLVARRLDISMLRVLDNYDQSSGNLRSLCWLVRIISRKVFSRLVHCWVVTVRLREGYLPMSRGIDGGLISAEKAWLLCLGWRIEFAERLIRPLAPKLAEPLPATRGGRLTRLSRQSINAQLYQSAARIGAR